MGASRRWPPREGQISRGGFKFHNGKWAYIHPAKEPPYVVSHSRLTGLRYQTHLGTAITLAQLNIN